MKKITIAHLGNFGSFTSLAAKKFFESNLIIPSPPIEYIPCKSFYDIFAAVIREHAQYGVFPIENSLAGSVYECYDELSVHPVRIIGEEILEIQHQLVGIAPLTHDELFQIKKVYSHPKALEQCKDFFLKYPQIEKCFTTDTEAAAAQVKMEQNKFHCGISSSASAAKLELTIVQQNIEDKPISITRFFVCSKSPIQHNDEIVSSVHDPLIKKETAAKRKCSIQFCLPHIQGALLKVLQVLSDYNINMTKLESRPLPAAPFEYKFFMDFTFEEGSEIDQIKTFFEKLRKQSQDLKIFGIF
jgi:prephenate dehydratase